VKEFNIGYLQEEETKQLFNMFDRNRDGTIQYEEFLHLLRGEMNDFRREQVERAFIILDKNNNGAIDVSDIK